MGQSTASLVRQHRARQRAKGLRLVQLWLPDTRSRRFKAQVAHDIAVLKAAEENASPEERAEWDAWERASVEGLPKWTGPDLSKPEA